MSKGIEIVIINGSVRPNNYTSMATALVADELARTHQVGVKIIHPEQYDLPFPGVNPQAAGTLRLQKEVKEATAIVMATPEYHGGISSVIKLVIENLGFPSVLAGKPVALLGVAAGSIGAIKSLEQLRGICSHIGAMVLPLPISVANVQKAFDPQGNILDPNADKLIRSVATNLMAYIHKHLCPAVTLERLMRQGVQSTLEPTG